jgi:hypothetical protein
MGFIRLPSLRRRGPDPGRAHRSLRTGAGGCHAATVLVLERTPPIACVYIHLPYILQACWTRSKASIGTALTWGHILRHAAPSQPTK